MLKCLVGLAVAITPLAASADPVAYQAVVNADFAKAEATLQKQLQRGSREPGVMLNLASVYHRTGRSSAALELYRAVRAERNAQMEMPDGSPAWSHDLAARGISRATVMASR